MAHRRPCGCWSGLGSETATAEGPRRPRVGGRNGHGQGELTSSLYMKQGPTITFISALDTNLVLLLFTTVREYISPWKVQCSLLSSQGRLKTRKPAL